MARRQQGLPSIPTEGLPQAQLVFLSAVKETVEKLIGLKGDAGLTAVVRKDITVVVPKIKATNSNATGATLLIGGEVAADGTDYNALLADVKQMMVDMQEQRNALAKLVSQLQNGGS